jgi:hypothetical protein
MRALLGITVLAALSACLPALAQTPLAGLALSPDITVAVGSLTVADEDVVQDDLAGNLSSGLSGLPAAAELAAYHRDAAGARLLVFDTTVVLPGNVTATPRDVVRLDGATYSILLAGAAAGIPDGVAIDAVTRATDGALVLSLDGDATLGGTAYADEDLVRYSGDSFSSFFDGSLAGLDSALDVDAADVLPNGRLLLSLDGSGTVGVGAVDFDDEDVLEVGQDGAKWQMAYDGSKRHPELAAADVHTVQALFVTPGLPFSDGFEAGHTGNWTWRDP